MAELHMSAPPHESLPYTDNYNLYEYYMLCTEGREDYPLFQVNGVNHLRSEFNSDVDALAVFFQKELGYSKGDVFTVFMPNNIEGLITLYALNRLGGIVNFVHPLLPPDVLKETLEFTSSKGIMILDSFAERFISVLKPLDIPVILCSPAEYAVAKGKTEMKVNADAAKAVSENISVWRAYPEILKKYTGCAPENPVTGNPSDTAVYLNGGGTTGKSKTIRHSNKALNEIVFKLRENIVPFTEYGVYSKIVSLPFFHAFGLCAGGLSCLVTGAVIIPMMRFDADKFVELLRNNKVYEIIGVPNMFRKLLAHPDFRGDHLKHVKYMFAGGDDVPPDFQDEFDKTMIECGSTARLNAGYGLTEACAICTTNKNWDYKACSIGKSVYGNRIEIFDDNQNILPRGEVGEIAITGSTVMQGYLTEDGREDEGVYIDANGDRWVLTGDLAYMDEDGFIFFRGRKKRLIIISGYNVYPRDIEELVMGFDFIAEACAVQGQVDGKPIVRLFVVLNDSSIDKQDVKDRITAVCEKKLSGFSVPRDIRFIAAIPRTRMEKVDFMSLMKEA